MFLMQPFEEKEVKEALFSMHPDKSPGLDGINPGFFQKHWDITGGHVITSCLSFLNNGSLPDHLNDTFIVLIPKKKQPESLSDLRPISLCNVLYKIISKVLANMLKKVLNPVLSDSQSAFTQGRCITDNVLIAFEIGHHMKRQSHGKCGEAALK